MKAIELFAGAGGAALGLEAAGFAHAALCEWDPDACATLRAAGLGPVVEGDVRDLDAVAAVAGERCDLLWSSFPCQAWSTASKRKGARDERNGWPWTVDAIDRFRPRWFLGENVRGLLNHRGGCVYGGGTLDLFGADPSLDCPRCYFDRVILRQLRERFDHVGYWLLDAADYGVPQHRRRVILWAGAAPLEKPTATHGPGRALPWVSMKEALEVDGCFTTGSFGRGRPVKPVSWPAPTVPARYGDAIEPWDSAGRPFVVAAPNRGMDKPSPTVVCSEVKGSGPGANPTKLQRASDALYLATGRRRLTLEECARLQDFPLHPWQGNSTARYRQVGNAVPPTLARVVGESVMRAEAEGTA